MKNFLRNIIPTLAGILLLTACSSEDGTYNLPDETGACARMCINIVTPIASDADMNSNGTQSRANDGYEAGISLENYIDVAGGDFRIYIFRADASDGNDTYVGCFEPEDVQTVAFSGYLNYRVMGPAPETLLNLGGNFKLMVAANWKTYPGNTELTPGVSTIDDICIGEWAKYGILGGDGTGGGDFSLSKPSKLIPFFGIREYNGVIFKNGEIAYLDSPISLLRAMAKIEVIIDTTDNSPAYIKDAIITGYEKQGYSAPEGVYSKSDYYHTSGTDQENWEQNYLHTIHLVTGATSTGSRRLLRVSDTRYIAYVPEYDNTSADATPATISLTTDIKGNVSESKQNYTLEFAKYIDGQADTSQRFNLERNCTYRFTCKLSKNGITVQPQAWTTEYDNEFNIGITETEQEP